MTVFLEANAPQDWSLHTLFCYPYSEGVKNLNVCFSCTQYEGIESPSLCERVTHFVVGGLLCIPFINTIVFIALRFFFPPMAIFDEAPQVVKPSEPEPGDEPVQKTEEENFDQLKQERSRLLEDIASMDEKDEKRTDLHKQLFTLEKEAVKQMRLELTAEVKRHCQQSSELDPELTKLDGTITQTPKKKKRFTVRDKELPKARFYQAAGLSQKEAANHLCGYYALFFMLQAVTGHAFDDRKEFHPLLKKMVEAIAKKRAIAWLNAHRKQEIPYCLEISIRGLTRDDMQYLIEQCDELAPLRETQGCFVLEIEEFHEKKAYSEPIKFLGKSKSDNKTPECFPIYFIVKDMDMHFYFVSSTKPGKFTVIHSLNYSVLNPDYFNHQTFRNIVEALSSLKITW